MAFIVLRNFDEVAVAGPSYVVSFDSAANGAAGPRVAEMVESFARENGINVGRLFNDPRNQSSRRIYLAVGDPQAESAGWLNGGGYPYFSREAKVEMRPYAESANLDPNGIYFVYGPEQAAADLRARFAALGYEGQVEPLFSLTKGAGYFGRGALLWCFLIAGLITILAVASGVVLNAKSYGIQRLQGQSFARILLRDLSQLARFGSVTAMSVCAATVTLLYFYNGLNQLVTFASIALSFAGIYIFAALVTHVITLALVHRDAILNAVKGEVTAGWAIAGSYLLRVAAIALILSVSTSAMASVIELSDHARKSQTWSAMGSAYYLRISPAVLDETKGKAIDNGIGQWIRDADTRLEAALAWRLKPGPGISGTNGRDVLVVNNKYLVKHEIYAADGARVRPGDTDTLRVLLPQRYAQQLTGAEAGVTSWAQQMTTRTGEGKPVAVQVEQIRSGQSIITYSKSLTISHLAIVDPVIVVVTGKSGVISNEDYTSIASRGELLIEDPDRAMTGLTEAGVGSYVLGMSPFAQDAADKYRDVKREFGLQVFNLVAAITVLLITAIALSIVYCRRNAQTLFVKYISGWGFLRTHSWILAAEAMFGLALMLWTWYHTTSTANSYNRPGAHPPPASVQSIQGLEPVIAGGVVLFSLALVVLILLRTNAIFVKAHTASLS
jgi:hypothetical protein